MQDRFKFRGMTLGGEWVYGNLAIINKKINFCGMTIEAGYYISNEVGIPFAYPVRPETVGQCTGLKDKNGKLIYEGDILKCIYSEIMQYCVYWEGRGYRMRVYGSDNKIVNDRPIFINAADVLEVIGNIHENKDLLEVGGK